MHYKSRVRWERVAMSSLGRPIHLSTPFICFSLSHANILCTQKRARASAALVYFLENNEFIQTSDFIFIAKGFFAIVARRRLTHWSRGCLLHFYPNNLFPESDNIDARKKGSMMMWLWWMGFIFWVWRLMGWLVGKRGMNWAWICCS